MELIRLKDRPEMMGPMARWFSQKWGLPQRAYLESMEQCLAEEHPVPGWYAIVHQGSIAAGIGIIENDFHDRKDLTPNLCALFTEPEYRGQGLAGRLLDAALEDLHHGGITPVYLITEHTAFYERYGWQFLCMAQPEDDPAPIRVYVHP